MNVDAGRSEAAFRQVRILHVTFMLAVLLYVGIALQTRSFIHHHDRILTGETMWLFRGCLIAAAVGTLVVGELMLRDASLLRNGAPGDESRAVQATSTRLIFRVVLTETIGIYGLFLFLLGGHLLDVIALCAVSLLIFVVRFPTRARWDRELDRFMREQKV